MSLTDTHLQDGYPISAFSWILLYREQAYGGRTRGRAEALVRLLWWLVHEGQKNASELRYGVLPATAVARAEAELRSASYQGKPILIESPSSELVVPQPIR
jgi:phosphate transport system substrate-binding protein